MADTPAQPGGDGDADDPALRAQLGGARFALDPIAAAVARAQARAALFGTHEEVTVGRYQLLRAVGAGGGGSVYAARDPELGRELAIKLIAAAGSARARALAEGQALARLSHPNVVPVFDVGVDGDRVYLAMELVRGQSLRSYAVTATHRAILAAYRQAGEGLAAAHAAGLIHRDFKPDNAVIGVDGRVRVIDFGLAHSADGDTAAGRRVAGTPRYMAPEQQAGPPSPPPPISTRSACRCARPAPIRGDRCRPGWARSSRARPAPSRPSGSRAWPRWSARWPTTRAPAGDAAP